MLAVLLQLPNLPRLLTTLFSMAAGLGVFLVVINRLLSYLRDGIVKTSCIFLLFVVLAGGGGFLGYLSGPSLWMLVPALVLAGLGAGEIRRIWLRRSYRGTSPVEQVGSTLSLMRPLTTTDLRLVHYQVAVSGWKGRRLRVAHLSDFHVSDYIPIDYYRGAVELVSQMEPDLIFMTGDFITELEFTPLLPEILGAAKSRLGVFAVLGNHDYWADAEQVAAVVRSTGVCLLYNNYHRVRMDEGGEILLTGCEIPWSGDRWIAPPIADGDLTLALAHSGDNIYRLSRAGIKAVFSGHYHAGQICLPGLGALVLPSGYGRRFDRGHFVVDGTHLFVTAGVGAAKPPFRIYCPPDVFVVDFEVEI